MSKIEPKEPVVIDGVKKLDLPFTTDMTRLSAITTKPERDPFKETYDSLSQADKQALSDGENTLFEIERRARILLEKEQRAQELEAGATNLVFKPTITQIYDKTVLTLATFEADIISNARSIKQKLDSDAKILRDQIIAEKKAAEVTQ